MLRTLLVASLAGATLALGAPSASATTPLAVGCHADDAEVAGTVRGSLTAYALAPGDQVSVVCRLLAGLTVLAVAGDGIAQPDADVAATTYSYNANVVADRICVDWYTSTGSGTTCAGKTSVQIPPQLIVDLVVFVADLAEQVKADHVDPVACPSLQAYAGTYGPIVIYPDGDVWVGSMRLYDCPDD